MNAAYHLPAAAFVHVMCHRLVIKMIKLPLYHADLRAGDYSTVMCGEKK